MTIIESFVLALIITVLILLGVVIGIGSGATNYEILTACEAELPRNEHCILIAVPEKGE
jgi:ribose 5-phosphate isomerase